jgi:hypothetical protein
MKSDEDFKEPVKYNHSKYEYDLYHEEEDIALPVIRVKRIVMPNDGEKWKIFHNTVVIFVIEGSKLNKKEKSYLHTPEGFNFILQQAKAEITMNSFKIELKKVLDTLAKNTVIEKKVKKK